MSDISIVEIANLTATGALIAAFLWVTLRCKIRIDCPGGNDDETA